MHVAIALFVALVVIALLIVVAGAAAFVIIPVALVVFGGVLAALGLLAGFQRSPSGGAAASQPAGHVPTTSEASYDPVVAPQERPR